MTRGRLGLLALAALVLAYASLAQGIGWNQNAHYALVYFNNDWEGFAVDNARALKKGLS